MKKCLMLIISFLFMFILCSCSVNENVNFITFIERFNGEENILSISDFVSEAGKDGSSVYYSSRSDNISLILKSDETNNITRCRLVIAKKDIKGNDVLPGEKETELFYNTALKTVKAFCNQELSAAESILLEIGFGLKNEAYEKNKTEGSFVYQYVSNELCDEFVIYNKWLCRIETTEKPENKNGFTFSSDIRTETVPHR